MYEVKAAKPDPESAVLVDVILLIIQRDGIVRAGKGSRSTQPLPPRNRLLAPLPAASPVPDAQTDEQRAKHCARCHGL